MSDVRFNEGPAPDTEKQVATGKKRADAITAIVLLVFSGFIITESLSMKLTSQYGPGPGFFPLGLGLILFVLSLSLLWDGVNPRKKDKASPFQEKKRLFSAGLVVLGLVGYALLITRLGYLLTTCALVLFLMGGVARDKLKTTVLTALGVTLLLYLIFQVGLRVHLPKGPFGF